MHCVSSIGNSVEALCEQLIEALHKAEPGISSDPFEQFFEEIHKEAIQAREEDAESFDTSADEEMESLVELYQEHQYSGNSAAWG